MVKHTTITLSDHAFLVGKKKSLDLGIPFQTYVEKLIVKDNLRNQVSHSKLGNKQEGEDE